MTETPDHVPCRHCGAPISWDDVCWTHDSTGFANCGMTILDGSGVLIAPGVLVDPEFAQKYKHNDKFAEPVGEWT